MLLSIQKLLVEPRGKLVISLTFDTRTALTTYLGKGSSTSG